MRVDVAEVRTFDLASSHFLTLPTTCSSLLQPSPTSSSFPQLSRTGPSIDSRNSLDLLGPNPQGGQGTPGDLGIPGNRTKRYGRVNFSRI